MHSERVLARFVLLFSLLYAAFGVLSPFFPSFLAARGLEPASIAVVLAAGTAVRLLTAPLAGRIADRLNAPRAVLIVSIAGSSILTLGYLGGWGFWPLLIISLASALFLGPVASLADVLALGASAQSRGIGRRSFDYGWVRGAGSAAFIAGSLLAGQAIGYFGLSVTLALQAGLLAGAALSAGLVPQQPLRHEEAPRLVVKSSRQAVLQLLAIPLYRRVALVAALVLGSHAMHDSFAVIRWREAGLGPELISLLWSESVAAEVLVFFVIGPALVDRLTPAGALAVAAVAGMLRWTVAAQTTDVMALALVQPLHGITFALLHLACMRLIARIVPEGLEGTAQAIYGTVGIGAASALLTLVSGALYGRFGAGGFWVMAALCLIALPLTLKLRAPLFGESRTP